jgi:hypothetical protein
METQPYSLQSPEQIAKDYGGNKQKIAQAMQMGIVDPTAGTLAGMFIDRMRSAQMQEQAPQQTVAQQVMGGPQPPQAPPQAPPPPSGGLGATPQAGPPMAPPGGPQEMIEVPMPSDMQPEGMAAGGLAGLSVPDNMFDEPTNGGFDDGYAGGGIVAFRTGGYNDFRDAIIAKESGGRYGVANTEGSGAMGLGQIMPDTARALAKRLGLAYRPELLAGDDEEARKYQDALTGEATKEAWEYGKGDPQLAAQYYFAGPNKKGWGPKTQAYGSDIMERLGGEAAPMPREADTSTGIGRAISAEDSLALGKRLTGDFPREELERARRYALETLSPEAQEEVAKMDMWEGLASMGFRLASSNSPNILQAIGEAATATLPELKLSKKERKAAKDDAVRTLMALEDVDRKTAIAGVDVGMDIYKTGISADQAKRALAFQEKELISREAQAKLDRDLQRDALEARKLDKTQFEQQVAAYRAVNPGLNDVQIYKLMKDDGLLGSSQGNMAFPGDEGGAGGDTSGMSIVGSRPVK